MKRNISLIMVFLFGCATAKMVEYVSFQDAVAKTKVGVIILGPAPGI